MKRKKIQNITPTIFEETEVRREWHNERELSKGWGQIATPLSIQTKGGIQMPKKERGELVTKCHQLKMMAVNFV